MNWDQINIVVLCEGRHKSPEFWEKMFEEKPQCLHDLLYDVVAMKRGTLGRGRRKKINGSLDEIWKAVYGE